MKIVRHVLRAILVLLAWWRRRPYRRNRIGALTFVITIRNARREVNIRELDVLLFVSQVAMHAVALSGPATDQSAMLDEDSRIIGQHAA